MLVTGELGKGKYRLVLVRLDQDAKLVQWSQEQIEEFTGAQVSRVVDISSEQMMSDCYNARRGQFDSDQISAFLDGMSHQPDERLLAVTRFDLYLSSKPKVLSSLGMDGDDFALLSSKKMGTNYHNSKALFPSEVAEHRFRKMLLRSVLALSYELPRNGRPESLLYDRVWGLRDIDKMGYEI